MEIDIKNLDKADVLAALYNRARPQGLGFLHYRPGDMTHAEAVELLDGPKYFDYVYGRVMKVNLRGDMIDTSLYDRDNGEDASVAALQPLFDAWAHRKD